MKRRGFALAEAVIMIPVVVTIAAAAISMLVVGESTIIFHREALAVEMERTRMIAELRSCGECSDAGGSGAKWRTERASAGNGTRRITITYSGLKGKNSAYIVWPE